MRIRREDLLVGGKRSGEGDGKLLSIRDLVVLFEFGGLQVVTSIHQEVDLLGVHVSDGCCSSGSLFETTGHRVSG